MGRSRVAAFTLALIIMFLSSTTAFAAGLRDIAGHWAKDDIQALIDKGIINGYPDKTFRPDKPVTRAEFAKIVAEAFDYKASKPVKFADVRGHWARNYIAALAEKGIIKGYPDGKFHPDAHISRAEMVTMLTRVVKLDEGFDGKQFNWWKTFADVPQDHWAYNAVEIANRLGILPPTIGPEFQPEMATNRAETAAMVRATMDLTVARGTLQKTDGYSTITLEPLVGNPLVLEVASDVSILRNNTVAEIGNLVEGDQVYVVSGTSGTAKFIRASGIVTRSDIMSKITDLTEGLITKEQLAAVLRGDWDTVKTELQYSLYDQLLAHGATPEEAEAIMTRDWTTLRGLSQERLAKALAEQWDVSPELIISLLEQDWENVQKYGEVELTQRVLGGLLL